MNIKKLNLQCGKFSIETDEYLKYNSIGSFESRVGGRCFELNMKLIRPSQVNMDGLYGYSLKFFEPFINENGYIEKYLYELNPAQIYFHYKGKYIAARRVHTYARGKELEIIDVKLLDSNRVKWINRLKKRMHIK